MPRELVDTGAFKHRCRPADGPCRHADSARSSDGRRPAPGNQVFMKRRRLLIDLVAVVWAVLWIVLAVQVAIEVRGLRDLSATVEKSGVAVREAGDALERIEQHRDWAHPHRRDARPLRPSPERAADDAVQTTAPSATAPSGPLRRAHAGAAP
jgi:hypothetical protein